MATPLAGTYSLTGGVDLEPTKVRQQGQRQQIDIAQMMLGAQQTDRAQTLEEKKLQVSIDDAIKQRDFQAQQSVLEREGRIDLQQLIGTQQMASIAAQTAAEKERQEASFEFQAEQQQELITSNYDNLVLRLKQEQDNADRTYNLEKDRRGEESALHLLNMRIANYEVARKEVEAQDYNSPKAQALRAAEMDARLHKAQAELASAGNLEMAKRIAELRQQNELKEQESRARSQEFMDKQLSEQMGAPGEKTLPTRQAEADIAHKTQETRRVAASAAGEEAETTFKEMSLEEQKKGASAAAQPKQTAEQKAAQKAGFTLSEQEQNDRMALSQLVASEGMFDSIGATTGNQAALNALNAIEGTPSLFDGRRYADSEDAQVVRTKLRRVAELGKRLGKGTLWGAAVPGMFGLIGRGVTLGSPGDLTKEERTEFGNLVDELEDKYGIDVAVG